MDVIIGLYLEGQDVNWGFFIAISEYNISIKAREVMEE